jgi:hypothetical protein
LSCRDLFGILHKFCDAIDDKWQVEDSRVVIGREFDMVFAGQFCGFDESL